MATRERFIDSYTTTPPWDIGRPQPHMVSALDELQLQGSALDLGCGTGEHVLELARRGLDAWGLDSTPAAIAAARAKAESRGLQATFIEGDALDLAPLGRTFDTVLDSGLFHVLTDEERAEYVRQLGAVLAPGGRHLMLGFNVHDWDSGPRGYTPEQLRAAFAADAWEERLLRAATFEATIFPAVDAWLSLFIRR